MVDIDLTCRLFQNIEENSQAFTININTEDLIDDLREKIYVEVKKTDNNFLDIDADDLRLWKVEINNNDNDEFSALVLLNDNTNNVIKLRGNVGNYWDDEERRPKEGYIHVVVESPRLVDIREKDEQILDKDEQILDLGEGFAFIIAHLKELGLYTPGNQDLENNDNLRNEAGNLCYALVANGVSWKRIVTDIGSNSIRTKSIDKRTLQKFCNGETVKPDDEVLHLIRAWVIKQREING